MAFWIQYKALMYKNWVLWRRNLCLSLCEVLFPIFLMIIIGVIRELVTVNKYSKQTFETQISKSFTVSPDLFNTKPPFTSCMSDPRNSLGYSIISSDANFKAYMMNGINNLTQGAMGPSRHVAFSTINEFNSFITGGSYENGLKVCFGVYFYQDSSGTYNLELRYNTTEPIPSRGSGRLGQFLDIFNMDFYPVYNDLIVSPMPYVDNFYDYGFLSLMNLADNYLVQQKSPKGSIKASFYPNRFDDYVDDYFLVALGGALVFFVIFSFMFPVVIMLSNIVKDKETRTREIMMMMGLKTSAYWISWISYYLIIYTVICIVMTIASVGMGVFKYSNGGLIFLYFWLFSISCIAISVFLSTFFSKSRSAVLVGIPFFLGTYFVSFAVADQSTSMNKKAGASLLPCVALNLVTSVITSLEVGQVGMQADNPNYTVTNYSHGLYFGMIIVDIVYLGLLAAYFEAVWPTEWGVKLPWYFPFSRKFWCTKKQVIEEINETKMDIVWDENVEYVDPSLEAQKGSGKAMIVRGLTKQFSNKLAVDGLNLDIFEGQIFGLLGHNGAGKTTTISMLTGLISPTSGEMSVQGKALSKDLSQIREIIGVCPQQNILFPDLTPLEHMSLFSKFKGISDTKKIEEMSYQKLSELELTHKKDVQSKYLSGGQKRKLQLALALIGDSPIVLLDEPTSGMDLTARRHMWDMLKNNKNGRIIILTTHYMEEADVLADRIAIMSQGKLKCCGSSLFLKSKYGVGYYLTIVRKEGFTKNTPIVEQFVSQHVTGSKLMTEYHGELSFQLPSSSTAEFEHFFEKLDGRLEELGIISYAVSATTLEEVFLRVAEGTSIRHSKKVEENAIPDLKEVNTFVLARDKQTGSLFFKHFAALLKKRILNTLRDKKSLVFEIFIPIILIIVGLALMMIPSIFKTYDAYELAPGIFPQVQQSFYGGDKNGAQFVTSIPNIQAKDSQVASLPAFSDFVFSQMSLYPYMVSNYYFNLSDTTYNNYQFVVFNDQKVIQSYPTAYGAVSRQILKSLHGPQFNIKYYNHPLPPTKGMENLIGSGNGLIGCLIFSLGFSFIPAGIVVFIAKERETNVKHQHMISGVSLLAYWSSNFFWDTVKHVLPAVVSSLIILAFQIDIYTDSSNDYGAMWMLIVLGGIAQAPFSYAVSFLFKSHSTAQIFILILSFITGSVVPSIVYVMHAFSETRDAAKVLGWVFKVFPNFCFGWGVLNIGAKTDFASFLGNKSAYDSFDLNSAGGCMLLLGVISVFYFFLVVFLELFETNPAFSQFILRRSPPIEEAFEHDDDVDKEAETALSTDPSTVQVNVKNICKSFKVNGNAFTAVNKVSFNVKPEECFALLGVNGAGKTTTFKMLTGEVFSDIGSAFIGGFNVAKQLAEARTLIGYCPQFDAISELLTGKENLELYAHIKGIPAHKVQQQVEYMLENMDLEQYRDVLSGTYSGGNKRKLSVAMALIGNPSVVFLDEPSAGMDPEARKKMWRILGWIKKQKSAVILTTHSMEEAEALCDRMTIMVRGRLKCIGTTTWIKNKFGDGYELEIKVSPPREDFIQDFSKRFKAQAITFFNLQQALENAGFAYLFPYIQQIGPGAGIYNSLKNEGSVSEEALANWCLIENLGKHIEKWLVGEFLNVEIIEHFHLMFKFKIKKENVRSIGYLFSVIEQNKQDLMIQDYAVCMTSLEQIFNRFAKKAELEEVERMKSNKN